MMMVSTTRIIRVTSAYCGGSLRKEKKIATC